MDKYLITIDGGTTNTRAALWRENGRLADACSTETGVSSTAITGSSQALMAAVQRVIRGLLEKNGLAEAQIQAVYASGMITSNMGLAEIPHLTAPAGLKEFAAAVQPIALPQICSLPVHFIPGLKNLSSVPEASLESMDMMRGEETEALALSSLLPVREETLLVLPGSHNKFVMTDSQGKLTGCLTTLSGELLSAVTKHTVIADAVGGGFAPKDYSQTWLFKGFDAAREAGLTRALFSARIINQFITRNRDLCAAFLLGAVLASDIEAAKGSPALKASSGTKIVIAGKEPLGSALRELFERDGSFSHVYAWKSPENFSLSGYGALLIARAGGIF